MADDKRDAPRPFDVRTVEYLLKLMSEHDLSEIALREGDQSIRLRKGGSGAPAFYPAPVAPPMYAHAPAPVSPPSAPAAPASAPAPKSAKNLIEIRSPMVGTFYSKPDPKKPDFVAVGDKINPKTVVCTIEAMKTYNPVAAECAGTVAEVCVKSGDFVEFDQVLFRVEPS